MANPTSVGVRSSDVTSQVLAEYQPALVATDSAEAAFTLDPEKFYILYHTGFDATGAGTADTSPVYLSFNETVAVATSAPSANKAILISGTSMQIGPGLTEVSTITSNASNEPVVVIAPQQKTLGLQ